MSARIYWQGGCISRCTRERSGRGFAQYSPAEADEEVLERFQSTCDAVREERAMDMAIKRPRHSWRGRRSDLAGRIGFGAGRHVRRYPGARGVDVTVMLSIFDVELEPKRSHSFFFNSPSCSAMNARIWSAISSSFVHCS